MTMMNIINANRKITRNSRNKLLKNNKNYYLPKNIFKENTNKINLSFKDCLKICITKIK